MPKVMLQGSGVVAFIGELEAASMTQHVGMHWKFDPRRESRSRNQLAYIARRHRTTTLGDENVGAVGPFAAELPERAKFGAAQWVGRGDASLEALNREQTGLEVELLPSQADGLAHPKSVPVHQGLTAWAQIAELDEVGLSRRLYRSAGGSTPKRAPTRPLPDWARVREELARRDHQVTLALLWEEYKAEHPDGY